MYDDAPGNPANYKEPTLAVYPPGQGIDAAIDVANDPHGVLNQIADIDHSMMQLRKQREVLLNAYHSYMKSYSQHYEEVINGPAESPMNEEEIPTLDDYARKARGKW